MLRRAESLNQTDPKRKVRVGADANWAGILPHPILLVNMYGSMYGSGMYGSGVYGSGGYLLGMVDENRP